MSPRPLIRRRIRFQPDVTYFKPAGVPMFSLKEVSLTMPELEAIRLRDLERKSQKAISKKMKVSQPTFSRILDSAHSKIASALVEGKGIKIEGGAYQMVRPRGGRFRAGAGGKGRQGGPSAAGPEGFCVCPNCGTKVPHRVGVPCYQMTCPKCKTKLTRE